MLALAKLASSVALKPAIRASVHAQQADETRPSLRYLRYADDIWFGAPPSGSNNAEPTPQDPKKPDLGHTLATVSISSPSRDLTPSPNPTTPTPVRATGLEPAPCGTGT